MNDGIEQLIEEMYDGYGFSNEFGNAYFRKFSLRLSAFDFLVVLKNIMHSYPQRFALDFMLSSSFLWLKLPPTFWVELILSDDLRVDAARESDQNARFSDIEFLSRYVKVDALTYFMESNAPITSKLFTLAYFTKYSYGLVPSELDDDELDDVYFVGKSSLEQLRRTLVKDFGFKKTTFDDETIDDYIDALIARFPPEATKS